MPFNVYLFLFYKKMNKKEWYTELISKFVVGEYADNIGNKMYFF